MRVVHEHIDDLIADLRLEHGSIYRKIVRMRTHRAALNEYRTAYEVGLWVTALVRHSDGDWVIEFGEVAGEDTQKDPDAGTEAVAEWREKVTNACDELGLEIRSGKYEVF